MMREDEPSFAWGMEEKGCGVLIFRTCTNAARRI